MKSKSEIFNQYKTMVDEKEVLTYGNAIKAMNEYANQFRQADVISNGTHKPKCDKCGDKFWIYEDDETRHGCECHYL